MTYNCFVQAKIIIIVYSNPPVIWCVLPFIIHHGRCWWSKLQRHNPVYLKHYGILLFIYVIKWQIWKNIKRKYFNTDSFTVYNHQQWLSQVGLKLPNQCLLDGKQYLWVPVTHWFSHNPEYNTSELRQWLLHNSTKKDTIT